MDEKKGAPALERRPPRERFEYTPREMAYAGAEWLAEQLRRDLSPFEACVADILGAAYLGIYHIERVDRGEWKSYRVEVVVDNDLATWDFDYLTRLVVLAHDACVRLSIGHGGPRRMKLCFWPRLREGGISERHPTMESAIASVRERIVDLRRDGDATRPVVARAVNE